MTQPVGRYSHPRRSGRTVRQLAAAVAAVTVLAACGGGNSADGPAAGDFDGRPWNTGDLSGKITNVGFGGTFSDAEFTHVWKPFTGITGVEVVEVPWSTDIYNRIESQVAAGRVDIDQFSVTAGNYEQFAECCLEDIDYSLFPKSVLDSMDEKYKLPKAVGYAEASIVLAYNLDAYPNAESQPKSWADFWDVERFPGKRSLQNFEPVKVIEAALLADGVAPEQMYPLDFDRAFRKLEQIKPHIVKWWGSGTEAQQLLATGEATMVAMSNARIEDLIDQGAKVAYTLNQALAHVDFLAVPKGAPNAKASMASIAFRFEPSIGARIGEAWRQPIPSTAIYDAADKKLADRWTTSTNDVPELGGVPNDITFRIDSFFWYKPYAGTDRSNYDVVNERFQSFIAG
ncbi:ABC transporter substrate-binding protein [Micromonospora lutea]|nr:ABC transporter substrate-binding protein [Micromonospora lutea]